MVVVINYIVERAVNSVINVKGLSLSLTAFSAVDFGSDRGRTTNKITAWLSNKAKLTCVFKLSFKVFDGCSHSCGYIKESWKFASVGALVITGESTADVDHGHGFHTNFLS